MSCLDAGTSLKKATACLRKVIGVEKEQIETGSEDSEAKVPVRIDGDAE